MTRAEAERAAFEAKSVSGLEAEVALLRHRLKESEARVAALEADNRRLVPLAATADPAKGATAQAAWEEWVRGKGGETVQADSVPKFMWQSGYASGRAALDRDAGAGVVDAGLVITIRDALTEAVECIVALMRDPASASLHPVARQTIALLEGVRDRIGREWRGGGAR